MDIEFSYYNLTLRELVDMGKEIHVRQLHILIWLASLTRGGCLHGWGHDMHEAGPSCAATCSTHLRPAQRLAPCPCTCGHSR